MKHRQVYGEKLRRGFSFVFFGDGAHLVSRQFINLRKAKICLLQPQTPSATLFVVSLLRHGSTSCGLSPEEFCSRHSRSSDYSTAASQHLAPCNAIKTFLYRNRIANPPFRLLTIYNFRLPFFVAVSRCTAHKTRNSLTTANVRSGSLADKPTGG
jgi:hypothetical protein